MPLYEYSAYDTAGKITSGLIDAPSQASAFGKLKTRGFFPINVKEDTGRTFGSKVPVTDMVFALEQLATLLKAGVPLPESLDSLVGQLDNEELKRSFARVKVHLEEGQSLAHCLGTEKSFPPILVKMVEAGESVGAVETILERFSGFMEKESSFKEKVLSSLLYPMIIMVASFGLIFFILTYIGPTLIDVFRSFNSDLPLPTQVLLFVGSFLKNNIILLGILAVILVVVYTRVIPQKTKDTFIQKIPFFGTIHTYSQLSRWARTLAMLHGGGVSLIKALASSREVVDNTVIRNELENIEDYVQKGDTLGMAMSRVSVVPPLVAQMTRTGEKSGQLEKMLETAAVFYEKEVDKKLSIFFKFLEPAIIMFLGLVVGFVALAALLPIFEMNKLIR
ncbi:MAG: type II secretion system F family protein [Vulcanimicrobiota bacterium]